MIFTLAGRLHGASLRSWNTTCILSRVEPACLQAKAKSRSEFRLILMVGWLLLWPADSLVAQELFLRHEVDSTFLGAHALQVHDLDNDGDKDILGAGLTLDAVFWWENTAGNALNWSQRTISETFHGARFVDAVDLDGDGDLDLFGAAASDDLIVWWENTAGDASQWTEHPVDIDFDFAMHLHAADLDNDGDLDLMGAALKGDAIHWWENTSGDASAWVEHIINEEFDGARHVCSVDMDGDGDLDLLGSAYLADDVSWWENTLGDATTWVLHNIDEDFDGVNVVQPVDIDGDGDTDLLGSADVADDVVVWLNLEGDGIAWERVSVDENFDGAFATIPADMDADGDIDVLGVATEANLIKWWENTNGAGTSWNDHPIDEDFDTPMAINVADMDGDGDLDVIGGGYNGDVVWWETDPASLPVELTAFDAVVSKDDVILRWETASELNNAGFEVQHKPVRSTQSQLTQSQQAQPQEAPWQTMEFVQGAGSTLERRRATATASPAFCQARTVFASNKSTSTVMLITAPWLKL